MSCGLMGLSLPFAINPTICQQPGTMKETIMFATRTRFMRDTSHIARRAITNRRVTSQLPQPTLMQAIKLNTPGKVK
jgi:hypothetical protein